MTAAVDFTACERLPGRAYNGANGKKIAVRHDGDVWLVKFPPSAAEKPTSLSYTNSGLSEHLASTIANMIGLKSQETRIGTFTNGRKVGYVDFFRRHVADVLAPSLVRIVPRIDIAAICAFIDEVPLLTDLQRTFYKIYLAARYDALFGGLGK